MNNYFQNYRSKIIRRESLTNFIMATSNDNNTLNERDPEELFRLKWNDFTVRAIVLLFHPIQRLKPKLKQKGKRMKENN